MEWFNSDGSPIVDPFRMVFDDPVTNSRVNLMDAFTDWIERTGGQLPGGAPPPGERGDPPGSITPVDTTLPDRGPEIVRPEEGTPPVRTFKPPVPITPTVPPVTLPEYTPPTTPITAPDTQSLDFSGTDNLQSADPGSGGPRAEITPGPTSPVDLDIPGVTKPAIATPENAEFDTSGLTNPLETQTQDELSRIMREQDYGTPKSVQDSLFSRAIEDIEDAMGPIYDRVKLDAIHRGTFFGDENTAGQFDVANEQSRRVRQARVDLANQEAIRAAAQRGQILGQAGQLSQSQRQLAQQLVTERANFNQRNTQLQHQAQVQRAKIEQQENEFTRMLSLQGAELLSKENEYLRKYSIDVASFNQRENELARRYNLDRSALVEMQNENLRKYGIDKASLTQRQNEMLWDMTLRQAEQAQRDRQMQLEQQRHRTEIQQRENEFARDLTQREKESLRETDLRQQAQDDRRLLTDETLRQGVHQRDVDQKNLDLKAQEIAVMDKAANTALANNIIGSVFEIVGAII